MNVLSKKDNISLRSGTIIRGKWNKKKYTVERFLGEGTVGSVYLCVENGRKVALKISKQAHSISNEVKTLQALNKIKVQDICLGPCLFDVDDWQVTHTIQYSFYVMEYINGEKLSTFIKRSGTQWIGIFLIQLLEQLDKLHEAGFVFGDLKLENLLVTLQPQPFIRLIDVGGTTKKGRSIKEFTAFYDRAYWRLGERKAEPSYDLFALVMVVLAIFYPKHFKRAKANRVLLEQKIKRISALQKYEKTLIKAIQGKFSSAKKMREALQKEMYMHANKHKITNKWTFIQSVSIGIVTLFYYFIYRLLF